MTKIPSEKEMVKGVLKLVLRDQKERKKVLDSIPEGQDKELINSLEYQIQKNEKDFMIILNEIIKE